MPTTGIPLPAYRPSERPAVDASLAKADNSLQTDQAGAKGLELVGVETVGDALVALDTPAVLYPGQGIDQTFQLSRRVTGENYQIAGTNAKYTYESSTFAGWSCEIGVVANPFQGVRFKFRDTPGGGTVATTLRVKVREGTNVGTILADTTVAVDTDLQDLQTVVFDEAIDSDSVLVFEFSANGKSGIYGTYTAHAEPVPVFYTTSTALPDVIGTQLTGGYTYTPYLQFLSTDELASLTSVGNDEMRKNLTLAAQPRLIMPSVITTAYLQKVQLFYRGMIESLDPYQYDIRIKAPYVSGVSVAGKKLPRYYEITPPNTLSRNMTVELWSTAGELIQTADTLVVSGNPVSSPATAQKVLCLGDSLTAAGTWVTELNRRLTGSGGSPTGKSFTNISFLGTQGTGANLHEGHAGKTWTWFIEDPDSPLTNAGSLDIPNYLTTIGGAGINQIYILLGWNSISTPTALRNADDWDLTDLKTILDAFREELPAVKITLLGLQVPSPAGLGDDYGDDSSPTANYWKLLQGVFGLKLAYKELCADPIYSSWVDWIDTAVMFDSDYNMPRASTPVNTRNATTELLGNNGVHPDTSGYYQIADAVYYDYGKKYCE